LSFREALKAAFFKYDKISRRCCMNILRRRAEGSIERRDAHTLESSVPPSSTLISDACGEAAQVCSPAEKVSQSRGFRQRNARGGAGRLMLRRRYKRFVAAHDAAPWCRRRLDINAQCSVRRAPEVFFYSASGRQRRGMFL